MIPGFRADAPLIRFKICGVWLNLLELINLLLGTWNYAAETA